ncbi:MAG: hypothetical protein ACKPKO_55310, partial [Candidatus Fonsibacter sp.]
ILGLFFPTNMHVAVEVTAERIDADPGMQPALEDLLTRLGDMWVPWAKFEGHPSNIVFGPLAQSMFAGFDLGLGAANTTRSIVHLVTAPRPGSTARRA